MSPKEALAKLAALESYTYATNPVGDAVLFHIPSGCFLQEATLKTEIFSSAQPAIFIGPGKNIVGGITNTLLGETYLPGVYLVDKQIDAYVEKAIKAEKNVNLSAASTAPPKPKF